MTDILPSSILNVSLFGSRSRCDNDTDSDLDVLIVVANGTGKTQPRLITDLLEAKFNKEPSLSWYGLRKIKALYSSGDLFAWHLHLEASAIAGTPLTALLGHPSSYRTALSDIRDLHRIAAGVEKTISLCNANAVFEMGILYVCARNIAMSASWYLAARPSFGRYSPYHLSVQFNIEQETYETMLRCRMASQRGAPPPVISASQVLEVQQKLLLWSEAVAKAVQMMEIADEQITTL